MTTNVSSNVRILGSVSVMDGSGIVRIEDRFDTDIDDLWTAITDPRRLAQWLCEVEGDLRTGGDVRIHYFGSGWEGTCRIEACEPPHRFQIRGKDEGLSYETVKEVVLTSMGDHTLLVVEERGMPADKVAAYGAGNQIEVEDLASYLAGDKAEDAEERWKALQPAYEELAGATDRNAAD